MNIPPTVISTTPAPTQPVMPGVQRFVLCGAALALGILGLHFGKALLIPLALAALLAFALDPAVKKQIDDLWRSGRDGQEIADVLIYLTRLADEFSRIAPHFHHLEAVNLGGGIPHDYRNPEATVPLDRLREVVAGSQSHGAAKTLKLLSCA